MKTHRAFFQKGAISLRSDRNEELQRLEEALLETERTNDDLQQTVVFSPEEVAQHTCTVRNTDRVDVDLDAFSEEVQQPDTHGTKSGMVALFVLLTVAFLGVIAWWLLRMKGLI